MDSHPLVYHRALPGGITRRRAIAWMAASAALAGAGCTPAPRERIHPWVRMPEARGVADPLYYASAVLRQGHAQGVLVGTRDGRPVKIEGNPAHPSSLGATDPFAQAAVLQLWDPDRSQAVVQRLGAADAREPRLGALSSWSSFESAWRPLAQRLRGQRGAGLALLTGPLTSPTLRSQVLAWLQQLPQARWYQHDPLADAAADAGARAAFGQPVQVLARFDRARCVVALGGDPFSDGPGCVRHAMDWARVRREGRAPLLLAAEVAPGLFGARADRRIALAPHEIDALARGLAAQLLAGAPAAVEPRVAAFQAEAAQAMRAAGPDAVLLAGPGLAPATHAALHAIHQRLGAFGRGVDLLPPLAHAAEAGTLAQLVEAMRAGAVDTLVVLDANPSYDAPAALRFGEALRRVRFSVHAGLYRDETRARLRLAPAFAHHAGAVGRRAGARREPSRCCSGHRAAVRHPLALGAAGIAGRRRRARRLAHPATGLARTLGRGFRRAVARQPARRLRRQQRAHAAVRGRRAVAAAAAPAGPRARHARARLRARSVGAGRRLGQQRLAAGAAASLHQDDVGQRRLPRPAHRGGGGARHRRPRTARRRGRQRRGARVGAVAACGGRRDAPLGYGRRAAGRVGNGVGFDAYALQPLAPARARARLERLPDPRHAFALAQNSEDPAGRVPVRSVPAGSHAQPQRPAPASLYPPPASPEHAWAMVIDLDACIGCNACTIACQAENNIPVVGKHEVARGHEMHWIRVDRYASDEPGGSVFQPVPCMHCEQAPCELVCPVGATMHDSEGLNVQVYNRCIGTRFCSNNCPYKVRRFNFLQYSDAGTESLKGQRNPDVTVRQRGVMEKCTYCLQRIARARQHAQASGVPLTDGDVVTACQAVCPTAAIHFGDLRDPASEVLRLRASPRHYVLLEELGTRPRTTYLARVRDGSGT